MDKGEEQGDVLCYIEMERSVLSCKDGLLGLPLQYNNIMTSKKIMVEIIFCDEGTYIRPYQVNFLFLGFSGSVFG